MTRINTNVSSLVAQQRLQRSNNDLNLALQRLSTGLRINTGKDDPAGLIASEGLRSDITSIGAAVTNTQRANQVISTTDSGLGQISSLLNDIRGLATEAANSGALSAEQIAANQLQVDSSLEAINRISATSSFQGRKLLDGSLDFITNGGANFDKLLNLGIQQGNLGTTGSLAVAVNVTTAATQAQVDITNVPAATGAVNAENSFNFAHTGAQATTGTVTLTTTPAVTIAQAATSPAISLTNTGETVSIAAVAGEGYDGAAGNLNVLFDLDGTIGSAATASVSAGTLTIKVRDALTTLGDIETAVEGIDDGGTVAGDFAVTVSNAATTFAVADDGTTGALTGGVDAAAAITRSLSISAVASEGYDGAAGNLSVLFDVDGTIGSAATASVSGSTLTIKVRDALTTLGDIETAVEGIDDGGTVAGDFAVTVSNAGTVFDTVNDDGATASLTGGSTAGSATIRVVSDTAGVAANAVNVSFALDNTITNNTAAASITGGNVVVKYRGTINYADIASQIDGLTGYSASITAAAGGTTFVAGTDADPAAANLAGGVDATGGLAQDVVFELSGLNGSEVFSFEAGTSISQLETAIDALSDSTGVSATVSGTTLQLVSSAYGSEAFANIRVVSEGAGGTFTTAIGTDERDTGTDVVATVNGITALGRGNSLSINTSALDLSTSVEAGFTGTANFTITGGGALFQLGPDVVTAQQARIGVQSVNTARLGGVSGRLYQLSSGGSASLGNDANLAATITDEAITQVTSLRGRLGAFQKTTLESNLVSLNDTLANLTEAQAEIRDADFAAESARLTRAQILVQAGTSVLAIANSNPQNALALLR